MKKYILDSCPLIPTVDMGGGEVTFIYVNAFMPIQLAYFNEEVKTLVSDWISSKVVGDERTQKQFQVVKQYLIYYMCAPSMSAEYTHEIIERILKIEDHSELESEIDGLLSEYGIDILRGV